MHAMAFAYFFNFYTQYCYFLFLRLCGYIRNLVFCVFVYMKIFIRLMDLKRWIYTDVGGYILLRIAAVLAWDG